MHPETTRRLAAHRQAELAQAMSATRRARHPGRPRPRGGRPVWSRLSAAWMWLAHARPLPGRQVL